MDKHCKLDLPDIAEMVQCLKLVCHTKDRGSSSFMSLFKDRSENKQAKATSENDNRGVVPYTRTI